MFSDFLSVNFSIYFLPHRRCFMHIYCLIIYSTCVKIIGLLTLGLLTLIDCGIINKYTYERGSVSKPHSIDFTVQCNQLFTVLLFTPDYKESKHCCECIISKQDRSWLWLLSIYMSVIIPNFICCSGEEEMCYSR